MGLNHPFIFKRRLISFLTYVSLLLFKSHFTAFQWRCLSKLGQNNNCWRWQGLHMICLFNRYLQVNAENHYFSISGVITLHFRNFESRWNALPSHSSPHAVDFFIWHFNKSFMWKKLTWMAKIGLSSLVYPVHPG